MEMKLIANSSGGKKRLHFIAFAWYTRGPVFLIKHH
jgi:hypothetical protein